MILRTRTLTLPCLMLGHCLDIKLNTLPRRGVPVCSPRLPLYSNLLFCTLLSFPLVVF